MDGKARLQGEGLIARPRPLDALEPRRAAPRAERRAALMEGLRRRLREDRRNDQRRDGGEDRSRQSSDRKHAGSQP